MGQRAGKLAAIRNGRESGGAMLPAATAAFSVVVLQPPFHKVEIHLPRADDGFHGLRGAQRVHCGGR